MHIHKIAFPPIDSPVILTEGEWLKSLKRYPFEVQSLPSASFNLIQQVGRLIRSNECHGEIVIYDRRLLTKATGRGCWRRCRCFRLNSARCRKRTRPTRLRAQVCRRSGEKDKKRKNPFTRRRTR